MNAKLFVMISALLLPASPSGSLPPCGGGNRTETDQRDSISPATAVRALLETQQAAWNRGDLDGFMAGYWKSPKLTFFTGRDKKQGWQATMDRYKARYQSAGKEMGHLTFSELVLDALSPDCVLARGRWKVQLKNQTLDGLFTLIVRKKPEGWLIIHDHTSAGEPMK